MKTDKPAPRPLRKIFDRAGTIRRSLGTRSAAGYLRNRGVSFEAALWLLNNSAESAKAKGVNNELCKAKKVKEYNYHAR